MDFRNFFAQHANSEKQYHRTLDAIIEKYEVLQETTVCDEVDLQSMTIAEDRGHVKDLEKTKFGQTFDSIFKRVKPVELPDANFSNGSDYHKQRILEESLLHADRAEDDQQSDCESLTSDESLNSSYETISSGLSCQDEEEIEADVIDEEFCDVNGAHDVMQKPVGSFGHPVACGLSFSPPPRSSSVAVEVLPFVGKPPGIMEQQKPALAMMSPAARFRYLQQRDERISAPMQSNTAARATTLKSPQSTLSCAPQQLSSSASGCKTMKRISARLVPLKPTVNFGGTEGNFGFPAKDEPHFGANMRYSANDMDEKDFYRPSPRRPVDCISRTSNSFGTDHCFDGQLMRSPSSDHFRPRILQQESENRLAISLPSMPSQPAMPKANVSLEELVTTRTLQRRGNSHHASRVLNPIDANTFADLDPRNSIKRTGLPQPIVKHSRPAIQPNIVPEMPSRDSERMGPAFMSPAARFRSLQERDMQRRRLSLNFSGGGEAPHSARHITPGAAGAATTLPRPATSHPVGCFPTLEVGLQEGGRPPLAGIRLKRKQIYEVQLVSGAKSSPADLRSEQTAASSVRNPDNFGRIEHAPKKMAVVASSRKEPMRSESVGAESYRSDSLRRNESFGADSPKHKPVRRGFARNEVFNDERKESVRRTYSRRVAITSKLAVDESARHESSTNASSGNNDSAVRRSRPLTDVPRSPEIPPRSLEDPYEFSTDNEYGAADDAVPIPVAKKSPYRRLNLFAEQDAAFERGKENVVEVDSRNALTPVIKRPQSRGSSGLEMRGREQQEEEFSFQEITPKRDRPANNSTGLTPDLKTVSMETSFKRPEVALSGKGLKRPSTPLSLNNKRHKGTSSTPRKRTAPPLPLADISAIGIPPFPKDEDHVVSSASPRLKMEAIPRGTTYVLDDHVEEVEPVVLTPIGRKNEVTPRRRRKHNSTKDTSLTSSSKRATRRSPRAIFNKVNKLENSTEKPAVISRTNLNSSICLGVDRCTKTVCFTCCRFNSSSTASSDCD